ncbi:MAG: ArsR/SmtB family transcription factor [Brevibacterium yomogidense]|uniref:Transcriptional regulator, ArsR family n=1 Tax=Brevibacterium yomogidense TaxID=946573 RepID=A0A1X6XG54_9MICO|nr:MULTISPECIES: metalloregulator ArsR/SmtB family transcription factor [Brevibacterium]SLM98215.1 Transcriptional regulator, ArsR family [Brevibacterium yomogidense]SMX67942.1 transcriptional regulator, ArsR family [Brevibacterium sp. Mu109]
MDTDAVDEDSLPTSAQVEVAAETFRMLSSSTRLLIVRILVDAEHDVTSLATLADVSVQAVSQHLAKLRLAGLVGSRREGRRIIYTVDDPHVVAMVEEIFEHIAPDGSLAPDPAELRPQRRTRR